ncbi:hypothetical protein EDC14_102550 [Hydrogenispora ethanolica]|uniref:Uncharacterized protein n=1 Tax=Hydrogenispora ethanolica TaxID=1082276 RepID=A0A4R1R9N8_HYDET|nr:hypothetical protein [Hydrogenispora ethanolica]TCL62431.1 hypothetical protein EDC14_102550 [Hydrogenispora ethanolica]
MRQEIFQWTVLVCCGVSAVCLVMLLAGVNRLIEAVGALQPGKETPAAAPAGNAPDPGCSEEELAAVMAVMAKLLPEEKRATMKIRVIP